MQNRVNPYGEIIETKARGLWMGNRGVLHNADQHIVRPYKLKAWITCLLQFKGRHREIMTPDRYTELFFLDEATSFASGHRPCFECRREDFNKFKALWIKVNPEYNFSIKTPIAAIDKILHFERMNNDGSKKTYKTNIRSLPGGTFISIGNDPYLIADDHIYLWTPGGYINKQPLPQKSEVNVLTPKSIVNVFRAGYATHMNIS
ncbi:MAG TPA: hypothetical protein VH396_13135 [Chitinophagaceae bacterium]